MEKEYWTSIATPLGKLAIISTPKAIIAISFQEGGHPDYPFKVNKNWVEIKDVTKIPVLNQAKTQFDEYFKVNHFRSITFLEREIMFSHVECLTDMEFQIFIPVPMML